MKELLEKLENLPSILSIEDELFFIDRLQTLPIDEIRENKEIFKRIISAIQESHQDNGIQQIWSSNEKIIQQAVMRKTRGGNKRFTLRELNSRGNEFTVRYIQYHPGSPRHYEGAPYWKISSGKGGTQRFPSE